MEETCGMPSHCDGEARKSKNLRLNSNGVVIPIGPDVGAGGATAVSNEEGMPAEGVVI